ncbi:MAG: DUF58 domain-containing protein, partial [Planctomycetota bacterium]
ELRAKVVVEGFMSGLHRSPYHGFSVEFTDYRQYSPGDDLRHLDWKLLARQDRKYIKRFEDETNLRCYLLTDLSRSMSYGTTGYDKAEYARTAAATLSLFFTTQRDAVGMITFDESITDYLPPRFRPGHLRRLMMCLERSTGGKSTDLTRPLDQIASTVTKRGLIILISDLLAPADELNRQLGYLRSMGHDMILLRILDPTEVAFEFDSAALFHDLESGKELYVEPQTAGEEYRRRFEEHEAEIRKTCDDLAIDFFRITTDQPPHVTLFNLVQSRARKGRLVARGKSAGGSA